MDSIFYDERLKDLFGKLTENVNSRTQYDITLKDNIGPVAEMMRISRAELEYYSPENEITPSGAMGNVGIFCIKDEWNKDCSVTVSYPIFETGRSVCTFYADKDYFWNDKEKADVKFFGQLLYVTGGNSWLLEMARNSAVIDAKTKLPNTTAFITYGEKLIANDKMVGKTICVLHIKNFRYINQKLGSRKADEILKKFGVVVKNFLVESEMLAILGGDNFAVIINNERVDSFTEYLSNISVPLNTGSNIISFDVAARAGFYEARKNDTLNDIMNAAFVALDVARAKETSDFVKMDPYMIKRIMQEKEISNVFPKALKEMEFCVFYQPKVNLEDNSVCGGEALVRWLKDGELIPPAQFIPVLEREGKVSSIDFYVFERVCQSLRRWIDMGIDPVRVSVNFSKLNLYNRNLTNEILSIMNRYGITSEYIEIELTEMSGYEDYEALCIFINNMKELGIKTSIDDFGTGYSSFNLIKDLNADIIKLDRSFLSNIDNKLEKQCRTDEIVIKNIVNMVNELDMEVIAEGVETIAQAEFLKKINCLKVQGFLFDKPMPEEEFEKILTTKKHYSVVAV